MEPGSHIGHYRIVSRLGAGGMGEVYLAHDERLERPAAVKILAKGANQDSESLRRFTVEAKAAAALSHPNIATIYDAGEDNGVPYLAMEYVEGETLSMLADKLPLTNDEIMNAGMQVADALVEAHSKGIIHRDIKPSNLIRNSRSQIKVLDFGLAKISAAAKVRFATTVSGGDTTQSGSDHHIAVGSLPYMSPEQALAKDVDPRTDIFSLGAVLYELASGRRAFAGSAPAAIFDSILNRTPATPRSLNLQITESLDRIIRKCLEKDPGLRYQTAQDLLADLKLAQRDYISGVVSLPTPKPLLRKNVLFVLLAAFVVFGSAFAGWKIAGRSAEEKSVPMRNVPITSFPGSESHPSFSPDGTQVAFSWNEGKEDDLDIYVKLVETGKPLKLTNTPASELSPSWSPDGRYIAFLRMTNDTAGFFLIPSLPGLERKLGDASPQRIGADAPFINWSPDGKQLVLTDRESEQSPLSLFLLDLDTNQKRKITSPPTASFGDSAAVFSPDGNSIAFVRTASLSLQDMFIVDIKSGKERRMTNDNRRIFGLVWSSLTGKIIFSSARNQVSRLWSLSPNGGEPEKMPGLADSAGFLALSRNGRRLAYTRSVIDTNIWRFQLPDRLVTSPTGAVIVPSTRGEVAPRYSPDGKRFVFTSNRSGALEIWVADSEGGSLNQLTNFNGPATGSPMWSPDGKFIAFDSRPGGNPDVYVVSADGGLPRRLTNDTTEELVPSWSRDGRWIYFTTNRTGRFEIFRMPSQGGEATQITRSGGFHGLESPDGQYVYYAKATNLPGLWRVPVAGGAEEPVIDALLAGYWSYWGFGKDGIYYVSREDIGEGGARYPFRFFQLATKRDTILTYLAKRPFNSGLSISPDFKTFLYTQVDQSETDIMMIDGFR